ncbi:MAG: asparaginase [Defluviitaleaceae bacterium]|nr:asparaginase [Defluviitaleaceae bacterium]
MPKKILVVETGGTFATSSVASVRTLSNYENEKTIYEYDSILFRLEKYDIEFEKIRPIFTLSENLTIELLNILIDALYKVDYSKYVGIIITHGTDTLAYTANIISMLFSHKNVPIVFVSSNHPIALPEANGVYNFAAALDFICTVEVQGVFVVYKNFRKDIEIHLGSRVKQMLQVIDSYESFKNVCFGKIIDDRFVYNENPLNPSVENLNKLADPKPTNSLKLTKRVMLIYPYVGMRPDFFNINENISAVVYGVYHSGTFCSAECGEHSINSLIEKLAEFKIPLFISEVSSGLDKYESFNNLTQEGNIVNIAYDISFENLFAKVTVAVDLFDNTTDIYNYVNNTNVFFEKVKE